MLTRFLCLHIRLCLIHHHNNECSVVLGWAASEEHHQHKVGSFVRCDRSNRYVT